jgi:DNA-binding beta-propeller fold protein YncE
MTSLLGRVLTLIVVLGIACVGFVPGADASPVPYYSSSFGSEGTGDGQLKGSPELAVDAEGNIWAVDSANNRVEKFNSKGEFLLKFDSTGTENGQFQSPLGIAIDSKDHPRVLEKTRIQEFTSTGEYVNKFGAPGKENGQLESSTGIAIDSLDNIWVTSAGGLQRVQKFNSKGTFLLKFGSSGSGDGQFFQPFSPAVAPDNSIWIADNSNNRVQGFNPSGEFIGKFKMTFPRGMGFDPKGNLFVSGSGGGSHIERWGLVGS